MVKKQVCFNLEESIIKQVKQLALDNDTTARDSYTNWVFDGLKSNGIEIPDE